MLVDTKKLHTVKDARQGLNYTPSEYERDKNVFVFRLNWDGEDGGDLLTYADALDFVATFDGPATTDDIEESRELLDMENSFRVGPDDDWYIIAPLPQPMTHDRFGELVALAEKDDSYTTEDFGVRPGVDFPASLAS